MQNAELITAATAVIGIPILIYQTMNAAKSSRSNALSDLYAEQRAFHLFFLEEKNLFLRPFFFLKGSADQSTEVNVVDVDQIKRVAEMIADFIEHIWAKKPILSGDIEGGWMAYIDSRYSESIAVRRHFLNTDTGAWYAPKLHAHLREVEKNLIPLTPQQLAGLEVDDFKASCMNRVVPTKQESR